jgi:hypothetical protein
LPRHDMSRCRPTQADTFRQRAGEGRVPTVWRSRGDALVPIFWTTIGRPDPPGNAQANGLLKHSAYFSQGRQRQRTPAAGGDRRQLEQPVPRTCPVSLGGASPDNARRSGPTGCDILSATGAYGARETALVVMLAGAAAGYGEDRRRPVTGGAVRGSRRAVGLASEGRGGSCRATRHPLPRSASCREHPPRRRWREPA